MQSILGTLSKDLGISFYNDNTNLFKPSCTRIAHEELLQLLLAMVSEFWCLNRTRALVDFKTPPLIMCIHDYWPNK